MVLGRQRRREGFQGSLWRRETFRGTLLPNVAFWNQKKISRKAPSRWPKDMLLGRQGFKGSLWRWETFKGSPPGKRPAGGQRTRWWAAKGAGRRLGAAYCLTLLSETKRKSPGKRPAGGERTCCWAAEGAGKGLRAAYKGSLLPNVAFWNQKKISRKAPGRWPKDTLLGHQGRRDTFRGSLLPNVAFKFLKPEENLQESARQVAKRHAAGPPRALGDV